MYPNLLHQEVVAARTREVRRAAEGERAVLLATLAADVERPACWRGRLGRTLRPRAPVVCAACTCEGAG